MPIQKGLKSIFLIEDLCYAGVNFIKILCATFSPIFLSPKNYKAKTYLEQSCTKHFQTKKMDHATHQKNAWWGEKSSSKMSRPLSETSTEPTTTERTSDVYHSAQEWITIAEKWISNTIFHYIGINRRHRNGRRDKPRKHVPKETLHLQQNFREQLAAHSAGESNQASSPVGPVISVHWVLEGFYCLLTIRPLAIWRVSEAFNFPSNNQIQALNH